ncbi:polysaccharide deacetylase family protein [Massilia sp. LXY-6]|uniref:polysaccharide deacetylase family protein n=1 Tax=Massilia sp. LXY-6 TaxID=3379823 RepID=UPI003EE2339D
MNVYRSQPSLTMRLIRGIGNGIAVPRRGAGRLCILNYHRILSAPDPILEEEPALATFRWQMQLLADGFNVLSLQEALAALASGKLPPRAVCITFDDGYRSVHDLALPVLREFRLPATVFVTTGYIGSGTMWNERIIDSVRRLPNGPLDLGRLGLPSITLANRDQRRRLLHDVTQRVKYLPPDERLALTAELEELAGGHATENLMLTPDMIRALAAGGVEIGAHTVSHPILSKLDDATARFEIEQCKHDLEAITGTTVRYFAYPNGKPGLDFDQRHAAMAKAAGYEAACSTAAGAASGRDDLFQLPRSSPWDATPMLYAMRLLRWLA